MISNRQEYVRVYIHCHWHDSPCSLIGNALTPFSQLFSNIGHLFVKAGATNHMHKGCLVEELEPDAIPMTSLCVNLYSRCATTIVVFPEQARSRASWTDLSDSASSALVASSSSISPAFLIKARAMAILCFCPPDN
ncbi:hypothetical protein NC651_015965 [Populus alba x Populus x berolinensis]|nr:hypothetical protein NC651_015965 [Populus alba x Populus x berolinensis]